MLPDSPRMPVGVLRSLAWFALLAVGQAAALALVAAGNLVGYQHYWFVNGGTLSWIAVLLLVVQALVVAAALQRSWSALAAWLWEYLPGPRFAVVLGVIVATSATVSRHPGLYGLEILVASVVQLVAIGNVIALAASLESAGSARLLASRVELGTTERSPRFDRFALLAAVWVMVVAALLALFSYQRHPHVPDELVYLLQARYFADGALTLPLPPAPLAFNLDLMHYEATRWYSPVPPGWPFALAIGVWLGVPWLVNPVLGGLNILLAHAVLAPMYPARTTRMATLFLAVSPWFVFMAMNFMTHQLTLFLALLGALAVSVIRERRARSDRWRMRDVAVAFGGGLAIGGVSLVRPLEGLATAALLGVWSLPPRWWQSLRPKNIPQFAPSALLAVGAIASGALVRPYNAHLTGDPSYFPIMAYVDTYYTRGSNDLGFGANRGLGWPGLDPFPGHGAVDVVVNANLNITSINVELMGWATGSLIGILMLLALRAARGPDWSHVVVVVTVIGLHTFYWFSGGPDFGARYWFLIIVSCAALAARGMEEMDRRLGRATAPGAGPPATAGASTARGSGTPDDASGRDTGLARLTTRPATAAALALSLAALLTFFPWRAVDKYHHYRNMRPDVPKLAVQHGFGRSLVFVRGRRHPDYASAAAYNPLDLRADVPLYAWDASVEAREEALRVYADRPVWVIDGPTRTGGAYQVVAGPLTAAEARRWLALP